ncbi:MAG: extracellular solute-binding protein [Firmicutes bacterium]|nr:extracellular solute-binding protein [Bacillota bacterium]
MSAVGTKRLLSIASVALLVSALAGCGTNSVLSARVSKASNKLTQLPKGHVTVTLGVPPTSNDVAIADAIAKAFEKLHHNITVKVVQTTVVNSTESELAAAAAGTLPDIIRTADVHVQYQASHGMLMNLQPYMNAYGYKDSQFNEAILKLGQYNGDQYVIPRGFDQIVVEYNPQLFKKFHVPLPKMGWTWQTFLKDCKLLTRKVGNTQYYAVGDSLTDTEWAIWVPFIEGLGGHIFSPNGKQAEMDSPATVKAMSEFMSFAKNYTSWFANLPSDPFESGHAAMDFIVHGQLPGQVNASATKWIFSFDPNFVNFPLLPHPAIGSGMAGYAVTTDAKGAQAQASAALMMFLLSKQGEEAVSSIDGSVPIRKDLAHSSFWQNYPRVGYKLNTQAFVAYDQYDITAPNDNIANPGPMNTDINNAFEAMSLGKSSVSQAMQTLNAQMNALLAQGQ